MCGLDNTDFDISGIIETRVETDHVVPECAKPVVEFQMIEDKLTEFVNTHKNGNTKVKTKIHSAMFSRFCTLIGERRTIAELAKDVREFNQLLARFFKDVRKKDGQEYEPSSLKDAQRSIDRHLADLKMPFSIVRSEEFSSSRAVLSAKQKNLRLPREGKEAA